MVKISEKLFKLIELLKMAKQKYGKREVSRLIDQTYYKPKNE